MTAVSMVSQDQKGLVLRNVRNGSQYVAFPQVCPEIRSRCVARVDA